MKFDDFKAKALALLSACPMKAAELAKATGATSAVYNWLKKLVIAGDIVKGEDGVYRLATVEELSEAFIEERIAEVEVIEMRMPRASMTVPSPKVEFPLDEIAQEINYYHEQSQSALEDGLQLLNSWKIADIEIPSKRRRSLNVKKVTELAESIKANGLINPVTLHKTENGLTLIAGLHRLEACKSLGFDRILCTIQEVSANQAELLEIDENLMRQELTVLEQADHIARREEILEAMGLRRQVGRYEKPEEHLPLLEPEKSNGEIISPLKTTEDIADEIGLKPRSVQFRKQIAKNIDPEVKETLRDTEIANSTTQLVEVARMEPEKQKEFAEAVQSGEVSTVKEFKEKAEPKPVEVYIPPTVATLPEPSFVPDINNYTVRDGHVVPKSVLAEIGDQSNELPSPVEQKKERNHFTSLEKSGKTDEHYTPEKITNFLYQFCPEFDLDPCSNPGKNICAKKHYTQEDNGLAHEWEGSVFINPPFSDVETWVNKALDEYVKGNCIEVVFLSKFDGRVGWFKPLIGNFSPFCIVQGYVSYYGNDGDAATFTTALWYLGDRRKEFTQVFEGLGWVCQLVDLEF